MSCDEMYEKFPNLERDKKKKTKGLNKITGKKISQPKGKQERKTREKNGNKRLSLETNRES